MIAMNAWEAPNARYIEEHGIQGRDRDVPDTGVPLQLIPGDIYEPDQLPRIDLADGVTARLAWGRGALLEILEMAPGSAYPEHTVRGEMFTVVTGGSATCVVDGQAGELGGTDLHYLADGTRRGLQAGPNGFKALEAFSPVRVELLRAAGVDLPTDVHGSFDDLGQPDTRFEPGTVCALEQIAWTPVGPPPAKGEAAIPAARARIVWGRNIMLSFVEMAPNSHFPMHIHPEDQLMICLRGALVEGLAHADPPMSGDKRNIILQPGGMVHSATLSDQGADALDVFWPVRPDYIDFVKRNA